jgi:hypothetical protein
MSTTHVDVFPGTVTVQPSAKLQQMMHRSGKKTPFRAAQLGIFANNSENTSRNASRLNCYRVPYHRIATAQTA